MEKELFGAVADGNVGTGFERLTGAKLGHVHGNTSLMRTLTYKLSFLSLGESSHCAIMWVVMLKSEAEAFNRAYGCMLQCFGM